MKNTSRCRTGIMIFVFLAAIVIAIYFLIDFLSPKSFFDLSANANKIDACEIICVTPDKTDEISLIGDDLNALLSQLEHLKYYKRGFYGSIMEGNLCHLFFFSEKQEEFSMIVSDLGKIYIGSTYYELGSDVDPEILSNYINMLLK